MGEKNSKIKTIFFDVGGVLLELNVQPMMMEFLRASGLTAEELTSSWDETYYHQFERGEISFKQYYRHTVATMPNNFIDEAGFRQMWCDVLAGPTLTVDLIAPLRNEVQVWFLTNTNEAHEGLLTGKFDLFDQVDGVIASHLEGCRKPEEKIYDLALERAGVQASQALFIDDRADNVAAAEAKGIKSHLYTGVEGVREFLQGYGFSV